MRAGDVARRGSWWCCLAAAIVLVVASSRPFLAQPDGCPASSMAAAEQLRSSIDDLVRQGRPVDAVPQARCLVRIAKDVLGPTHATTRNLQRQLAGLLRNAGLHDEAAALAKEITRGPAPAGDDSDIDLLIVTGKTLIERGDYAGAMRVCLELRTLLEARGQQRTVYYAIMLNECGRTLEYLGHYKEAEEAYRDAEALARELKGPRYQMVGVALNNLGLLLSKRGKPEEAIPVLEEALRIESPDNPERAAELVNLGIAYRRVGRFDEARASYLGARDVVIKAYGPRHPRLTFVYDALAVLAWGRGDMGEALGWQAQSNEIAETTLRNGIGLGTESQKLSFMATLAGAD